MQTSTPLFRSCVRLSFESTALRDVCATANEAGALGVFYWEGAWITVGDVNADNSSIWEEFGSGWASSYGIDIENHLLIPLHRHGSIQGTVVVDNVHRLGHLHIRADVARDSWHIDHVDRGFGVGAIL